MTSLSDHLNIIIIKKVSFMRKSASILLVILLTASLAGQVKNLSERHYFEGGDWEVLFAVALGLSYNSSETSTFYFDYGNENKQLFFELTLAPGFYIIDGLSLEPELSINSAVSSLSLIGNLSYAFHIRGENVYPFLKIGFGKSSYMCEETFGSFNSDVLSGAAGLKIIQGASFAIRLEVNYKKFISDQANQYPEVHRVKYFNSGIGIKIGGSVLF